MQYVNEHTLNKTNWTLIAENKKQVALQFDRQGSVRVHVADEEPADLDVAGILVSSNTPQVPATFGLGNLPTTAKVWAKAVGDDTVVTVLAY